MRPIVLLIVITILCCSSPARAELFPGQVMIIASINSAESLAVAQHYAQRRSVPVQQIVKLDLPSGETMSREEYERKMVLPLRRTLEEASLHNRIRVLVTVYGVPLRVAAPVHSAEEQLLRQ